MSEICKNINQDFFNNHSVLRNHLPLLKQIHNTFHPQDEIRFIKAPGRVNLIGEHTDYNMGPVLPCAINREIVFCLCESNSNIISVSNVSDEFENIEFSINRPINPYPKGHWGNYIKAGCKGILDYLNSINHPNLNNIKGFQAIVSSTLPRAAGMSSSSALVVASAYAFVQINNLNISTFVIAEICAEAEHFVGTAGGGMDQAACLLGKDNSFLKIEFNPLRVSPIAAPEDTQFVLFHSLIEAEKSGKVRLEYNRRVLECNISVELFNEFISAQCFNIQPIKYIGEIQSKHFNMSDDELNNCVTQFINQLPESLSIDDISKQLDLTSDELTKRYKHILGTNELKEPAGGFKIKGRFKHVFTECARVYQAIECINQGNLSRLGELLNASHKSLSEDYEVSNPELDDLVKLILDSGASGARMMGAGFGGVILSLVTNGKINQVIEKVKNSYYGKISVENIDNFIFPCVAVDGTKEL